MIPFHRYPHPDFVPYYRRGTVTNLPVGATGEIFRFNPIPGIRRLRLSHLWLWITTATAPAYPLRCTIPGFELPPLIFSNGNTAQIQIPLFHTISPHVFGTIEIDNTDTVPIQVSCTLQGFGTNCEQDDPNILTRPGWSKFLIPPLDAVPFIKHFNTNGPLTFKAPFIGDRIRIYGIQGNMGPIRFRGPGLSHYIDDWPGTGMHQENEESYPLLGYLEPGAEYQFLTTTGAPDAFDLYGWGFKW